VFLTALSHTDMPDLAHSPYVIFKIQGVAFIVSFLLCPCAQRLSLDVPALAGFLCDRDAVLRDAIKETTFSYYQ
jgi:hypothetical protein